jgi:hypothetical protein
MKTIAPDARARPEREEEILQHLHRNRPPDQTGNVHTHVA